MTETDPKKKNGLEKLNDVAPNKKTRNLMLAVAVIVILGFVLTLGGVIANRILLLDFGTQDLVRYHMDAPNIIKNKVCLAEGDTELIYNIEISFLKFGIAENIEALQTDKYGLRGSRKNPNDPYTPITPIGRVGPNLTTRMLWTHYKGEPITDRDLVYFSCIQEEGRATGCYTIPVINECD